ncbi:MAG: P-loop NTPase, partial [Gammaproteobacteria bacterium]|nr:P-loop NTPase [Gammaproteobacteria bacterium]
ESEHHLFGEHKIEPFVKDNEINFLGKIPLDPSFVKAGDNGKPILLESQGLIKNTYEQLTLQVEKTIAMLDRPKKKIEDIQVQLEN